MILITSVVSFDVFCCCRIGLVEVFFFAGEAAPTEGAVAKVKEERSEDVFDIGRIDETVEVVFSVFADGFFAGIINGFEEGIAVIKEIGASLVELADHLIVMDEGLVDEFCESFGIFVEHVCSLLKGEALRAVAAVVSHVTAGLVAHEIDVDVFVIEIFEQVDNVAVVSNGTGRLALDIFLYE